MDACTITKEARIRGAKPAPNQESGQLRTALREMHALARKYLALTGGGLSDGTEAAAVERAAALFHHNAPFEVSGEQICASHRIEIRR